MIGHNWQAKVTEIFPKKISLQGEQVIGKFISHDSSKDICQILGIIMGCNWYINFTFKFTKKFFFGKNLAILTQPGPRQSYLISHDLIYIYFKKRIIIIVHNKQTKAISGKFYQTFALGKMRKALQKILFSNFNIVHLKKPNYQCS